MIFIPVFFVFYFWKLKQYESGLEDFAENHLVPRRRTIDAVALAAEENRPVDIDRLVEAVAGQGSERRDACAERLTVLTKHYRLLLAANGGDYPALVRAGYHGKANYLLFCRQLARTETAFNMSLLPTIDADSAVLRHVAQAMAEGFDDLLRQEADAIFS